MIASWLAGERPQRLEGGAAFRVPTPASLVVRLHYQRPVASERAPITNRGELGVYLSREASRKDVRAVMLESPGALERGGAFTYDVAAAMTLVAVRQISGPSDATAALSVIAPDGGRSPLMQMTVRPQWPRQYVLARPLRLARGSRIDVRVTAAQTALWKSLLGPSSAPSIADFPIKIAIEVVD